MTGEISKVEETDQACLGGFVPSPFPGSSLPNSCSLPVSLYATRAGSGAGWNHRNRSPADGGLVGTQAWADLFDLFVCVSGHIGGGERKTC